MRRALIGHTGFVGSTISKQSEFTNFYRSTNIEAIKNQKFDEVVCAGAPGKKWLANKDPVSDAAEINRLIDCLSEVVCDQFVLISTVDVFQQPSNIDEASVVDEGGLQPYGLHRHQLEKFVRKRFSKQLTVRLPGLVGPGLRKNVLYDHFHNNDLHRVETRNEFQFYPTVNLWYDIEKAKTANLTLIHLTSEPVSVGDAFKFGFGSSFENQIPEAKLVRYDFKSKHASLWGRPGPYQYSRNETFQAIRSYAQSESKSGE